MISEIGKLTGKLYPTEENSRIQTSFPCVKRSTVGELPILKSVPWKKKNPLAFIMTKKKIVANNKGRHRPPERRGKKELPWNTKSRTK